MLSPRLDIRQSQSLVMTPQLQQAIRLLALSNLEIESFIAEELNSNPLLEAGHNDDSPNIAGVDDSPDLQEAPLPEPDIAQATDHSLTDYTNQGDNLDAGYAQEVFHHDSPSDNPTSFTGEAGIDGSLGFDTIHHTGGYEGVDREFADHHQESLADHLEHQARLCLTGDKLAIANHMIDLIDEAGYLTESLASIAAHLNITEEDASEVLTVIQGFDPTGVGARNLSECLMLQAQEADRLDPAMKKLITNLEWLSRGALSRLKKLCQVDDEDFADMIQELRNYNPKPGLKFGSSPIQSVTPDIFIKQMKDGWAIELNTATLPRLLVNRAYYAELKAQPSDRPEQSWLDEKLASANWLIRALDQRARTIIKVTQAIVQYQEGFFLKGIEQLKPLTLRQVAETINMHESTVSRVTNNKYFSCAQGIFELKYLFSSGIQSSGSEEGAAAEAVKSHIARFIAQEGNHILSDDKLVDLLKAKGFAIARRTVAKYREAIGLGSSVQRRRQKAISAS
ncbi:MAG: RNA polymerase factor sigma-54 [Zymomonas mobilis]|uniref:RNA polymerase sigma-54 factor n=1 Tax=Zymomonas mobilis TaxID=542 RepID=A0A542VZT4_ZYMMB|nr:RNA polymerase factor sigma-54 [Zymomonas mobilis]TQL16793.1 RNA polymerase RpoN-/SigL-like sigma 54 subunit [Zymomonas mobilis]